MPVIARKIGGRNATCSAKNLFNVIPDTVSPPLSTLAIKSPTTGNAVGIFVAIVVAQ
jgi:hypothetical protein